MIGQDLAYVAVVTKAKDRAAEVLGRHLGLKRYDLEDGQGSHVPVFAIGESALALFPVGHPAVEGEMRTGVHHIAISTSDLASSLETVRASGMTCIGAPQTSLGGRKRVALDPSGTAGVKTFITEPITINRGDTALIERLDHIGVASADNSSAIAAWNGRLKRPIESQQTDIETMIAVESFTSDKHGVVYHTRSPIIVGGLRVAFITIGDTDLEFLQNFDPSHKGIVEHGNSGSTRQDQGAIAKFIAARGEGLHHIAMKTPNIDAVLTSLDRAGVKMIDKKGRPGSRAGLIGFVHPEAMGGVLLHFDERP